MIFDLFKPRRSMFQDDQIALYLSNEDVYNPALGIDDGYTFLIYERKPRREVGYISLRLGESSSLYYLGHIGYRIDEPYRGHGYAARACELMIPLMQSLHLHSVCITANPDNIPSRKTCEKIGCILESIVDVPPAFQPMCQEATQKCRYILLLDQNA